MPTAVLDRVFTRTNEETVAVRDERARREEARAREFNGQISENYARLLYGEPTATAQVAERKVERAPLFESVTTPAKTSGAAERISQYVSYDAPSSSRKLFENLAYKNGSVYDVTAPAKTEEKVAVKEVARTATAEEENEDSRPTTRTMETLHRKESHAVSYSLASEVSAKAKMLLATIALVIIVAIAVICINTSVLNSLSTRSSELQTANSELSAQYEGLRSEIELATSDEQVVIFAEANGMTK